MPVREEHREGYQRDKFPHWLDDDGDGCDARAEVLLAEAIEAPSVGKQCRLTGGVWISAYDSQRVTQASGLDVDHVVALAEIWDSGGYEWGLDQRRAYANDLTDPRTLIAVTATANRVKSDQDPAQWLPPMEGYRCTYIADWVAVKTRWQLTVDPREHDVLMDWARRC